MKLVVTVEWEAENREQETSGGAAKKPEKDSPIRYIDW